MCTYLSNIFTGCEAKDNIEQHNRELFCFVKKKNLLHADVHID